MLPLPLPYTLIVCFRAASCKSCCQPIRRRDNFLAPYRFRSDLGYHSWPLCLLSSSYSFAPSIRSRAIIIHLDRYYNRLSSWR
ncbi:hypothetical protein ASPBRDRAFT_610447 [Aspergillus brasiliensis CBS 101740]|uniref:Uncharacterized protein n=1 Tax=Aspergillus brasiliensis (strain CBS 101740 / IMI 381727 / IBT 21946) TaxID=767769 RepID=A0A1L9UIA5_ASPBC|nr:hypothetical protein ASPBRDRAFT_610447 [Aspergillus brasiliensis CBS 101740]